MSQRALESEVRAFLGVTLGANRSGIDANQIFRKLSNSRVSLNELAAESQASEQTMRRYLTDLEERDLLQRDSSGYCLTTLGELTRSRYEAHLASLDQETLHYFLKNDTNFGLLLTVNDGPFLKSELAEQLGLSPSRVRSVVSVFENRNWLRRRGSRCLPTETGRRATWKYEKFATGVVQIRNFAPVLRDLGELATDMPVEYLATAEMTETERGNPQNAVNVSADLARHDLNTFYGCSNIVNRQFAEAFMPAIRDGAEVELIIPEYLLSILPKEGEYAQYVKTGLTAENFQLLIVRNELPLGFGVYDNETVLLSPFGPNGVNRGVITTTDETIRKWMTEIYERQRERAWQPSRYTLRHVLPDWMVPDSVLHSETPPLPEI